MLRFVVALVFFLTFISASALAQETRETSPQLGEAVLENGPAQPGLDVERHNDPNEHSLTVPELDPMAPPAEESSLSPSSPELRAGRSFLISDGRMDAASWLISGVFAAGGVYALREFGDEELDDVADVFDVLLPIAAFGSTWLAHDGQGAWQYTKQYGATALVTRGLKETIEKNRPDGGGMDSFPSGHAGSVFSGASFIHRRYGPRWGVPAYVLATATGLSRVESNRHYLDDVLSGASIALLSNWTFVHPIEDRVSLNPIVTRNGFGMSASVRVDSIDEVAPPTDREQDLRSRMRYSWAVGSVDVPANDLVVPGIGTDIDFRFSEDNMPSITAMVDLEYFLSQSQELQFRILPFNVYEIGGYAEPTPFEGVLYPAHRHIRSEFLANDWRLRWRIGLKEINPFEVKLGAGVAVLETEAKLLLVPGQPDIVDGLQSSVSEITVLPLAHVHVGVRIVKNLELYLEIDWMDLGDQRYSDEVIGLRWRLGPAWDMGLSIRRIERELTLGDYENNFQRDQRMLTIAHRF
ncbi:MAG: phosphatase PAP2 family protein [bacterium]|nr:phosphatase PAP2 family protein [bacterium]